jgi:hypothetical protein
VTECKSADEDGDTGENAVEEIEGATAPTQTK